jgi:predicted HTH domain antitoxin
MSLTISDDILKALHMDEREARVEIACRLYDAGKLAKPDATRFTGLSRVEFEEELTRRGLPWIRVDWDETYEREFAELAKGIGRIPSPGPGEDPRT